MRHPLTSVFLTFGILAFILSVAVPIWPQYNKHSTGLHPNGVVTDDWREWPLAVTSAGHAVMSGLCFLAAAVINVNRRDSHEEKAKGD